MRGVVAGYMNGVLALIALALGYIVCTLAKKEKGLLKIAGYTIGAAIIAISTVIVLGKVVCVAKWCSIRGCPFGPGQQSSMSMTPAGSELPRK